MNGYRWLTDVSVPSFGFTVSPRLVGLKGAVQFVLFVIFFHFRWVRKWRSRFGCTG
jgi:hypothetical protein